MCNIHVLLQSSYCLSKYKELMYFHSIRFTYGIKPYNCKIITVIILFPPWQRINMVQKHSGEWKTKKRREKRQQRKTEKVNTELQKCLLSMLQR